MMMASQIIVIFKSYSIVDSESIPDMLFGTYQLVEKKINEMNSWNSYVEIEIEARYVSPELGVPSFFNTIAPIVKSYSCEIKDAEPDKTTRGIDLDCPI